MYHSPNIVRIIISRRLRYPDHVVRKEEGRRSFKILTGRPTEKRLLGSPRRRWKDVDLQEIGINTGNWIDSAQYRDD